ncbi:MAG: HEAT repeat domain-containing protein [Planctomycetota bacterium]
MQFLSDGLAARKEVRFVPHWGFPSIRLHTRPADDLLLLLQDPDLPDREFVIRAFPPPPGLVPDFFLEEPERTLSDREATRVAAALKTELEHSSASVRRAAASELAYYKSSSARRALLAAADDPEPWVRKAVAEALAHGRSPARAKELIRMLKEHPSRRARQTAVLALGQLLWPDFFWFPSADEEEGSRPALPEKQITAALVSALDDPSPRVRAPAASALARCSEKNARHALLAALTDQSVLVRAEAAWAAGIQKDKRALPRLKQMVQTGEKPERLAAVSALPSFGQPGELALVRAMTDADLDVRCDAANALGEDLSPRTITALCSLVRTGGRDAARRASWKLLPIKTQQVTEALAAALERPHPGLRARAAWELAERGDARGVPVLIERFDDPEVNWLPGRLQKPLGRKAVPALIDALGHQQRAVRMGAARSLGGLKAGAAAKPLNDVLTDRRADRLEVFAAAEALAQIGTPAARKALDRHLDHRSRAVRLIAAAALAGAGSTRGLPILVRTALTSKTDDDRSKAEQALEYLGAKAAPALAAELGRAGEAGRAAAEMLVRLRGPGLDALFGVLADEDHPGRARAAAALDDRDERPWALSADDVAASHAQRARLAAARVAAILDDDRAVRLAALKSLAPSNWAELRRLVRWPADSREAEKPDAREQRLIDALRTCLSDSDPAVRAAAIGPLARYVWAVSLEPLRRALKDEDVRVRLSAARALDQLETPSQHRTLAFLDAADAGARAAAVSALVAQGLRSVPDAIAALDDADPRVRIAAANTLAALMDPRATPALIEVLRGDKVAAVRAAAAAALGGPEEKKEAGTVEDIFADPQVGEGRPVAPPGIMDPAAVDPLIAALEDDAYLVRRAALFALVWPGDLRALRPILGMWTREAPLLPERGARVEPWRRPEWIEYVRDRDPALKAARALVRRAENDPASLERRLSLLDDLRPRVRLFAVTGLAADTEQITAELVRISLHDRNDVVRQAAARALAWGPKGAGRKGLVAGAKDPDPAVRRHALEAAARSTELFAHLGRGGPRGVGCRRVWVLDMFIAAMDDEDPAVRKTARLLVDRLPLPEKRTKEELRAWWREAWPWPFF